MVKSGVRGITSMGGSSNKKQKVGKDGAGKRVSPYLNFCSLNRDKAKLEHPSLPQSKALSLLWKSLSPHEKSSYSNTITTTTPATDDTTHQGNDVEDINVDEDMDVEEEEEGQDEEELERLTLPFPLARVKRIMKMDKDLKQTPNEATTLIALATQGFLQILAEASWTAASQKKRKTVRFEDVASAISANSRFSDFLDGCLKPPRPGGGGNEDDDDDDDDDGDDEGEQSSKKPAGKPPRPPPPGTRPITHFFASS